MSGVKRCAACGKENTVSEMKICMHNQMHRYVCDMKCMHDFYNPPKKPAAPSLEDKVSTLEAERDELRAQAEAMRAAVTGYLQACDDGAHDYEVKSARHNMRQALAALISRYEQAKP